VEITCRVYRPRRPRESPLFRLVEQHLEELLRVWPTRFHRQHGPLRPVVERVLREFLKCGLLEHGFARLWCSQCRRSVLVGFSCRGRSFCPSCEKKKQLLAWRHPGFSAHVGEPIGHQDKQRLEDAGAYLVRNPLSLKKLVYLDGQQAVLYRSRMNPSLGRNFEALDPLEWLARMSDHIPDPGRHRTILYGHYANRVRGARQRGEAGPQERSAETFRRRCPPTWARLIAKVYQVDPLVCTRCGQKMQMIAFLTDQLSIRRILDHLGLSTPPQDKPPPIREILRVAEHGEGWGVPAEWE